MQPIHIYTDGACKGNPGSMGIGVIIIPNINESNKHIEIGQYIGHGTNNIAELTAIDIALDKLEKLNDLRPVALYSDSQYAINVLTKFNSTKNVKLIQQIKTKLLIYTPGIKLIHVFGHQNNYYNNLVDQLASNAALTQRDYYKNTLN